MTPDDALDLMARIASLDQKIVNISKRRLPYARMEKAKAQKRGLDQEYNRWKTESQRLLNLMLETEKTVAEYRQRLHEAGYKEPSKD